MYGINVFGNISLENCNLSHSQGFNIFGGYASIENCSFYKNQLNFSYADVSIVANEFSSCESLQFTYCSPKIVGNYFNNISGGITGFGEELNIIRNEINNGGKSIHCDFRVSQIIENCITNCEYGILMSGLVYAKGNKLSSVESIGIGIISGAGIINNNTLFNSGSISIVWRKTSNSHVYFKGIIENNYIQNSSFRGFSIGNVAVYIGNNTVINSDYADIEAHNSLMIIFNSTFSSQAPFGISAQDCNLYILNTTFNRSSVALELTNTSAVIINSTVLNDGMGKFETYEGAYEKCHLLLEKGSIIKIKDTVFDEDEVIFSDYQSKLILPNKTMRKEEKPLSWRFYANVALIVVTVTIITILIWIYKRGKRKEQQVEKTK